MKFRNKGVAEKKIEEKDGLEDVSKKRIEKLYIRIKGKFQMKEETIENLWFLKPDVDFLGAFLLATFATLFSIVVSEGRTGNNVLPIISIVVGIIIGISIIVVLEKKGICSKKNLMKPLTIWNMVIVVVLMVIGLMSAYSPVLNGLMYLLSILFAVRVFVDFEKGGNAIFCE